MGRYSTYSIVLPPAMDAADDDAVTLFWVEKAKADGYTPAAEPVICRGEPLLAQAEDGTLAPLFDGVNGVTRVEGTVLPSVSIEPLPVAQPDQLATLAVAVELAAHQAPAHQWGCLPEHVQQHFLTVAYDALAHAMPALTATVLEHVAAHPVAFALVDEDARAVELVAKIARAEVSPTDETT